jgi:hypothetical protein
MDKKEGYIEKLIITIKDKKTSDILRDDMITAGVPKIDLRVRLDKENKNYNLTIYNAQNNLGKIITMFQNEEYGLSIPEIEELLNIKITM